MWIDFPCAFHIVSCFSVTPDAADQFTDCGYTVLADECMFQYKDRPTIETVGGMPASYATHLICTV